MSGAMIEEHTCEACVELSRIGTDLRGLVRAARRLTGSVAPLSAEYLRLHRSHPRCAACGVLVGPDHHEASLTPEPEWKEGNVSRGQIRYEVCPPCYRRLYVNKRTVPQQRKYEGLVEKHLGASDDALEAIVLLAGAEALEGE